MVRKVNVAGIRCYGNSYPAHTCYRLLATTQLPVTQLQVHRHSRIGRVSLSLSDERAVNGEKQDGDNVVNTLALCNSETGPPSFLWLGLNEWVNNTDVHIK